MQQTSVFITSESGMSDSGGPRQGTSNIEDFQLLLTVDPQRTVTPPRSDPDSSTNTSDEQSQSKIDDQPSFQDASLSNVLISLTLKDGSDSKKIKGRTRGGDDTPTPKRLHRTRKNHTTNDLSSLVIQSDDDNDTSQPLSHSFPTLPRQIRPSRSVQFNEVVSALLIPERSEYSAEQKAALFQTKREIARNIERNLIEFAAEGYCWKDAFEEDDMITDSDGERVHPAHLINASASGRQAPPPASCEAAATVHKPSRWSSPAAAAEHSSSKNRHKTRSHTRSSDHEYYRPIPQRSIPSAVRPIPQRPIHPSSWNGSDNNLSLTPNHYHQLWQ